MPSRTEPLGGAHFLEGRLSLTGVDSGPFERSGLSLVRIPNSFDFVLLLAIPKPSTLNPRFKSSRTEAARLGIRRENRQSSTAAR